LRLKLITKLGSAKVEYLINSVAQIKKGSLVLELFGGTGSSTEVLSRYTKKWISLDIAYGQTAWAGKNGHLVCGNATKMPFCSDTFDYVIAPDSPRTRFQDSGVEWGLSVEDQKALFLNSVKEAYRVLKIDGVFAATAVRSWAEQAGLKIIKSPSRRLGFKDCDDPVVYCKGKK